MFFIFEPLALGQQFVDFSLDHLFLFVQTFVQTEKLLRRAEICAGVLVFQSTVGMVIEDEEGKFRENRWQPPL